MFPNLFLNNGRTIGIRNCDPRKDVIYCGEGCPAIVLASIGYSSDSDDIEYELLKAQSAIQAGAKIITDHSVAGNIEQLHKKILQNIEVPLSYLTIYELFAKKKSCSNWVLETEECFDLIESQLARGITLLTVHVTATREMLHLHPRSTRKIISTSRGGAIIASALERSKKENPYWLYFDRLLGLFKKYRATLSLGSTYRPASVCDAGDKDILYWEETKRMGSLVGRAIAEEVPVMVEGIGHAPIHLIPEIVKRSKKLCHQVPYRVLSVSTDIALGQDHISGAIAISSAVSSGADLATCVTRAEHLGRPTLEDIVEGVRAAKIAAHSADLGRIGNFSKDERMNEARSRVGCSGVIEASIDMSVAQNSLLIYRKGINVSAYDCTMCGDACALIQSINNKVK